jgi:itaconate CoA-transferase
LISQSRGLGDVYKRQARNRWTTVDTPNGEIAALLPPGINDSYEYRMDPIPAVGEHTEAILKELGMSDSDIASMRASGAI